MAKMNSVWKLATAVCVIVCLCLALAACGGGKSQGGGEDTTTQSTTVGKSTYTVQVRTINGVELKDVYVYVYTDSTMEELETQKPLENGTMSFEADTSDSYVVALMGVPVGYNQQEYYALTGTQTEIVLTPAVITGQEKPADKVYGLGDVMYDFSITDSNGEEYTLSQLLQEKDAVVLNFWYLNCTPCKLEFPYLEMAYAEYSDRIEVLGINCEDGSDGELNSFAQEYELTFPLAIGDKDYWCPAGYTACPTTIVVDRYGTIVYMHTGYFDEVAPFNAMFRMVTGEDYEQTLIEDINDYITEDDQRSDGSEERPYEMGGSVSFDVKVPANGKVYYNLYRLIDVTMRIENPDAYVIIDGVTHYPTNGVIEVKVSCEDTMTPLSVAFGNTSGTRNTIHVEYVFEPGNVNNPIELVVGENEIVVTDVNGLGCYYTYTATTAGTLNITVQSCTAQATAVIQLYNENTAQAVYDGQVDSETGLISYCIQVNEGDRVQIIFGAASDPEVILDSVTIHALASILEDGGTGVIDGKAGYSVTVVDQNGNPVPGAWVRITAIGESTMLATDEEGKINVRLRENAYVLELTVPAGYVADTTSYLWSPAIKDLYILVSTSVTYTVQVQTQYGEPQENVMVQVYSDAAREKLLYAITTDSNGLMSFSGKSGASYYLTLSGVDSALLVQEYYKTEGTDTVIILTQSQAAPGYSLGDTVEDFSVTDIDGVTHSLQELLAQKDAVILVFWRTGSVECTQLMNMIQQLYETYGSDVAILALNPVDTLEMELQMYQSLYDLTYPLARCDKALAEAMGASSFPTTVVIDREGKICLRHSGMLTREQGDAIAQLYAADDYTHISFSTIDALMEHISVGQTPDVPPTPDDPEDPEESEEDET